MKKFLKVVFGLAITVALVVGLPVGMVKLNSSGPSDEELLLKEQLNSKDYKKYEIYTENTAFNVLPNRKAHDGKSGYEFTYDFIKPVMESVDSSYIWCASTEGTTYAVSKESMQKKLDARKESTINDIDYMTRAGKVLIKNMTKHAREVSYKPIEGKIGTKKLYWSYNPVTEKAAKWRTLSAFDKVIKPEDFADQSTTDMTTSTKKSESHFVTDVAVVGYN